jgi:hypothetical protein
MLLMCAHTASATTPLGMHRRNMQAARASAAYTEGTSATCSLAAPACWGGQGWALAEMRGTRLAPLVARRARQVQQRQALHLGQQQLVAAAVRAAVQAGAGFRQGGLVGTGGIRSLQVQLLRGVCMLLVGSRMATQRSSSLLRCTCWGLTAVCCTQPGCRSTGLWRPRVTRSVSLVWGCTWVACKAWLRQLVVCRCRALGCPLKHLQQQQQGSRQLRQHQVGLGCPGRQRPQQQQQQPQ